MGKNRTTLLQQFSDFINRVAPFDGDPLIQKSEHLTVETDLFDSALLKDEVTATVNSPGAAISLSFASNDSYTINTSGSVDTAFVITISNLGHGQIARILIVKKTNDTFSVAGSSITPLSNISQSGTSMAIFVMNVKGTLITFINNTIAKSDNVADNLTNQLATSKAVRDLNLLKPNIAQESWNALTLINGATEAAAAAYANPRRAASYYKDTMNRVWLTGVVDAGTSDIIATLPAGYRPLQNIPVSPGNAIDYDFFPKVFTSGNISAGGTSTEGTTITLDGISFTTHD